VPLPAYGACDLGAINLTRFIIDPFTQGARLDLDGLRGLVADAVRMLDDVIDASGYPLPEQAEIARGTRRIGLGVTGLADALILLGQHYGAACARETAAEIVRTLCETAYRTSVALAREKGPFPFFDRDGFLASPFIRRLPDQLQQAIRAHGIRNSHLISIAPAGTISLLAGNVSGGIEPVFAFRQRRTLRRADGAEQCLELDDYAYAVWRKTRGDVEKLPPAFVASTDVPPAAHLQMQAAVQPWVDSAISKTINVPEDFPFAAFRGVFESAYDRGLKGCTLYRPSPARGAVLTANRAEPAPPIHCCATEREGD
jgi:ribonucleoside-diphosphate reductase alpha chain